MNSPSLFGGVSGLPAISSDCSNFSPRLAKLPAYSSKSLFTCFSHVRDRGKVSFVYHSSLPLLCDSPIN